MKKKYQIIYADPPWKYKENWGNGAVKHHYSTMNFEDIKNLPVPEVSVVEFSRVERRVKVRENVSTLSR